MTIFLTLFMLLVGPGGNAGLPPATSIQRLEERYHAARTLRANFLERYRENGKEVRVEAGKAYFLRPGKMRWEYESPEKSEFLVDGKYVWFYVAADHTVTRMPAKKSEDWRTPIAFLTTGMKLERICSEVRLAEGEKAATAGNEVYRCVLRGAEKEKAVGSGGRAAGTVLLEVSPANELARIVIAQGAGLEIEFLFKDWEWNPELGKDFFTFTASPGTVIVNGVLPEAPGMRQ